MKRFTIALALIVLSSAIAFAQGTTGSLSGTVSGPDGVLPGATVTATDIKTGKEQTVTSGGDGNFKFAQLEFGTYTVKVTAAGFKTFVANELKIDVGREYTLPTTLQIGDVSAEVVVTAGADVVTSTTAQVSTSVSPQQILSLPLITRNPLSLTALQAGVSANTAQNTTINGLRTTFTNITRDGINIQDTFIRTNATDFAPGRPSVDDTGEFTITTSNQEADQGYGGAQIRLVTPRGTKDFHGALFAYNRNSKFAANNFFNNRSSSPSVSAAPPFRNRNQFGGKASWRLPVPGLGEGTPAIFWDKAFFFFAYEGIRDPLSTAATRTILTPSARTGGFNFTRAFAGDPINNANGLSCPSGAAGSACSVSNILTFARSFGAAFASVPTTISPYVQNTILSQIPSASNFTGGDNRNTAGYRLLRRSDQTRDQYSTRIDVDIDDKDSLTGIYNYNKESNLRPDADTTLFTTVPEVIQFSVNKQFTMAFRRVFSSNFINEVRGGIFTSEVPFNKTDATPSFFTASGLVTVPINTFLSQGRNTKAFNFQDNADWILGNHALKFGGQTQIFRVNSYNDAAIVPTFTFAAGNGAPSLSAGSQFANTCTPSPCPAGQTSIINNTFLGTANNLLTLLGGLASVRTQSFNVTDAASGFQPVRQFTPFRNENHSLYVADRWQALPGLTLNVGVRYELFPALRLNNGIALEPVISDIDNPIPSLNDPNGKYDVIGGNAGRKHAYYKTDYDNFAPSLGVAWTPGFKGGMLGFLFGESKTVLRAGYSHVYGNDSIITSINNAAVGNVGFGRTPTTLGGLVNIDSGVPAIPPPTFITPPRTYLQNNGPGIGNFFGTVFSVDPKLKTPKVEQYSFGLQRELPGGMAFEIRYVGSRSTNLARGVDLAQIDIVNNGFLADFKRAQSNLALSVAANPTNTAAQTPFCSGVTPGCVPLTIFQNLNVGSAGHLQVGGTNGLATATFVNALNNGTPADLAISFVNSTSPLNINNQPCVGSQGAFTCNPNAVPFLKILPNNQATGVIDYFLNDARYRYDSLQAEVRKRFSNGLYFQVNYTYSKNLTNAIGTSQALFEPYLDNNNQALDYQRADFDTTHVFNFNGIYQLPFGQGKKFLSYGGIADKVLGGWEISGLGTWTSGAPITFVDTRGTLNRAGRSTRQTPLSSLDNQGIKNLVGIFEQGGNIYFLNPAILNSSGQGSAGYSFSGTTFPGQVFFNTQPGQTGNIGRALIDGPKFFNLNMALLKNIKFTESMRIQLRMEAFNVINNVNFNISAAQQLQNINSNTFGQLTSTATSARELQFAARFEF